MAAAILSQFSDALAELSAGARNFLASARAEDGSTLTGVLWKPDAVVVSEQALGDARTYDVEIADNVAKAELAGRDPGTNVAVLKLDRSLAQALPSAAAPRVAEVALLLGRKGTESTARLAIVRSVGGAWQSLAGGTIDHRISLDGYIGSAEEGGPVLSASGAIFGVAARGARRESLVIPAATVERAVTVILEKGGVERGWLGV